MNAEIIAVGSELLTPLRLDTNSLYLTRKLGERGIEVVRKSVVGDDHERLTAEIRRAREAVEVVVLSGGLGPTLDDLTRDAAAGRARLRAGISRLDRRGHRRTLSPLQPQAGRSQQAPSLCLGGRRNP